MSATDTNEILNRLLIIHHRSLAMYLGYAPPWHAYGQLEAAKVLGRIEADNRRMVDRIGRMILDLHGTVSYGEFPMLFTAWHDVSFEFLLKVLIDRQTRQVAVIEKYADALRFTPMAHALALEALGEAKAHLDMLLELKRPTLVQGA
jgi:hypothetical protein